MVKRIYDNSNRDKQKQQTREKIIEVMTSLLAQGEDDIPVAELAERSGVSVRTVYQHFPDKAARYKAIDDWVAELLDVGMILPKNFDDIPNYIERRIDYIFEYESLLRVVTNSGLQQEINDYRQMAHRKSLEAALQEKLTEKNKINGLVGFILATLKLKSIYEMRDVYSMTEQQIKAMFRTMIEALLEHHVSQK